MTTVKAARVSLHIVIAIASEAIQTVAAATVWIASSLSLLAMTANKTRLLVLAAGFARALLHSCPSSCEEGAGNAGCTLHPRSRVLFALNKNCTRAYR